MKKLTAFLSLGLFLLGTPAFAYPIYGIWELQTQGDIERRAKFYVVQINKAELRGKITYPETGECTSLRGKVKFVESEAEGNGYEFQISGGDLTLWRGVLYESKANVYNIPEHSEVTFLSLVNHDTYAYFGGNVYIKKATPAEIKQAQTCS